MLAKFKLKYLICSLFLVCTHTPLLAASHGFVNNNLNPFASERESVGIVDDIALKNAINFLNKKKYQEARRQFEAIWKQDFKQYRALIYLADIEHQNNNLSSALNYLETAKKLFPKNPHVLIALGRFHFAQKEFEKAKNAYNKAIALNKTLITPYISSGVLYLQVFKGFDKAIEFLEIAISLNPNHGGAHYALASAYAAKNNIELATQHFEIALNLAPEKTVQILSQMALLYTRLNKLDETLVIYDRLLAKEANNFKTHTLRGDIFLKLKKSDLAISEYDLALKINPKYIPAYLRKAMYFHGKGDLNQAEPIYRTVITLNPNIAVAYNNLANLLWKQKGWQKESIVLAKKAVTLMPDNSIFIETLKDVQRKS